MPLQSKTFWTKPNQSQTLSAAQCFTRASDHKWLLCASTRFHDVMATEFAKERRRRRCLASCCVVSDGSRCAFSHPAGFWQPLLWHDWIVWRGGEVREGRSACKVTHSWSQAWVYVPPKNVPPWRKEKRLSFSWKPLGWSPVFCFSFAASIIVSLTVSTWKLQDSFELALAGFNQTFKMVHFVCCWMLQLS